ncbi:amine oxidase [Moelleriella libera RCEF 2490]|uniref:Amine oxidase n=1 Tax=Moelleriella libera RCEF 2490 TaxID=1081109 RepID=A0A168ARM4_9HYPO|nr:amine oxidase [Moelleriella libera RCEF 2490]
MSDSGSSRHHGGSSNKRVAVVGGGVAGIACSWELRNHNVDVDIYESSSELGGHANSVPFRGKNGQTINVDTGFVVMDETTYPHFNNFLGEIGIQTIPTDMSFGVATIDGVFEWSSRSIQSFIGTLTLLFSPWLWRLIFDIVRFSLFAQDILTEESMATRTARTGSQFASGYPYDSGDDVLSQAMERDLADLPPESIGDYLVREGYSRQFMKYFLIPMVAAPWCIDVDEFGRSFPAKPLIRFMKNHGLLDTATKTLQWRSFRNGSRTYVDAFQALLPRRHKLHLNTPIQQVTRTDGGDQVLVTLADGCTVRSYDHVVLAVHANQAVTLLGNNATDLERRVLGCFRTSRNVCYLHSDTSLLPKRPSAHAAWNCILGPYKPAEHESSQRREQQQQQQQPLLYTDDEKKQQRHGNTMSLTFDMNALQDIPLPDETGSPGRVLVSMNPFRQPSSFQSSHVYYHPLINSESILMTRYLHTINGVANVSFAGAWMGFGFHEDGFVSGAHAARIITQGRAAVPPLDLVGNSEPARSDRAGLWRNALKVVVLGTQQFLNGW